MTALQQIAALLKDAMGFDPAALAPSSLPRAARKRALQCGQRDDGAYLVYLRASPLELSLLVEELVVPETWFFRDGKPFQWLARHVLEEWLPANPQRPFRLLSVPCSSGEEPYSAVMTLIDAGFPAERIAVDAVDISQVALGKARRGLYGRNSFRGVAPEVRDRHFAATPQGWQLGEAVRQPVNFTQGNLLAPDFAVGRGGYDAIFCRNLLIYFNDAHREQALAALERLLLPEGVLFVGHAEGAPVLDRWFSPIPAPQAFAYHKRRTPAAAARPAARASRPIMAPAPAALRPAPPPAPAAPPANSLEEARKLADRGRLAEAAVACEKLLRDRGPSAEAYYLLGLVHDAGRDLENARDFFAKAVYLEPGHQEALVHLALLAERQGDAGEAKRWRQRAERAAKRQRSEG